MGKSGGSQKDQRALESDPSIRAVYTQASETSTGVRHPVQAIADLVKKYEDKVIVVDAITGIGVFNIPTDAWGTRRGDQRVSEALMLRRAFLCHLE